MSDPTYLITNAGPDHDETEAYSTEALARAAFAEELECQNDDASDGFDPGQPTPMLLRAEVLLSSEWVTFATAEEDSEDGARCRANGWDYLAKLTAFEPDPPAAEPVLLAAANRALVEEVERMRAEVQKATGEAQRFATSVAIVREHGATEAADLREELGAVRQRFCFETRRLEQELAHVNKGFDSYMRSLAESVGCDMENYALPSAHGNDRLRWAVLISDAINSIKAKAPGEDAT